MKSFSEFRMPAWVVPPLIFVSYITSCWLYQLLGK
jgi:hypothetical protein